MQINRIITAESNGVLRNSVGQFSGFKGVRRSELNKLIADTYGELVEHWHKHFRPKHFTVGAYNAYGYHPRSKKYNKRKGHNNPLVFSGESKRYSETYRVHKTKNGARCVMPLVRAFNFRTRNTQINMRLEFLTTNAAEIRQYGVIARKFLHEKLKGKNVKIKVTI